MLMELCEQTLERFVTDAHKRIQRTGLHSVDVIALGLSLVDALEGLHHRARLIHLDVKPGNVLIPAPSPPSSDAPRRIKLGDFGLATQLPTCVNTSVLTHNDYSAVHHVGTLHSLCLMHVNCAEHTHCRIVLFVTYIGLLSMINQVVDPH